MSHRFSYYLVTVAVLVALSVVILGAYTRLTDAGLGCPDWPGCYGHMTVPKSNAQVDSVYTAPLHVKKAWTEMVHRYVAGTLVLLILGLNFIGIRKKRYDQYPVLLPLILLVLVVFQAVLGMWTVTWKLLPLVVMGHLLGGFAILTTLWCLRLQLKPKHTYAFLESAQNYRSLALIALFIVIAQIALGGWVSSNYAGLVCVGFPSCNGLWLPPMKFGAAFNLFSPIGNNYQGGLLNGEVRMVIQMVHRMGAFITAGFISFVSIKILLNEYSAHLRVIAITMLSLVLLQFVLGILNVEELLALPIALAHNAVAAILLLSVVTLVFYTHRRRRYSGSY